MNSVVLASAEPFLSALVREANALDPTLQVYATTSLATSALTSATAPIGGVLVANPSMSWSFQRIDRAVRAVTSGAVVTAAFVSDDLTSDARRADEVARRWLRTSSVANAGGRSTPLAGREVVQLGDDLTAPAAARRFVREVMAAWGRDDLVESAQLCASELATNAVLHASSGPIEVALARDGHDDPHIHLSVSDRCVDRLPVSRRPSARSRGGRGLRIVEASTARWGVTVTPVEKSVWCELGGDAGVAPFRVEPLQRGASAAGQAG